MPRTRKVLQEWRPPLGSARKKEPIEVLNYKVVFCRLNGTRLYSFRKVWQRIFFLQDSMISIVSIWDIFLFEIDVARGLVQRRLKT